MIQEKTGVRLRNVVRAISSTVDLINNNVTKHHERVTYIAYKIGLAMSLNNEQMYNLIMAASMHDIGVLSDDEESSIIHESIDCNVEQHADTGYLLLKDFEPLKQAAEIIKYHHHQWGENSDNVPVEGHIIHLADTIEIIINKELNILHQQQNILETVESLSGHMFCPDVADAFKIAFRNDHDWLALDYTNLEDIINMQCSNRYYELSYEELDEFSKIISYIIDFRSRYTATHSSAVAAVAFTLGRLSGFDDKDCNLLMIAGHLHDLGKIAIPPEVLDKQGKLTEAEYSIMRSHTYHTYRILNGIEGMETITRWASHHHERLDGSGYPFGLKDNEMTNGAKIVAVADVFSALEEERPYRPSMDIKDIKKLMSNMADNCKLCPATVSLLFDNIDKVLIIKNKSQQKALTEYNKINNKEISANEKELTAT
jgi:HD-GYP domain-containing protein (c-di-GMP phosphodiesterase class II)